MGKSRTHPGNLTVLGLMWAFNVKGTSTATSDISQVIKNTILLTDLALDTLLEPIFPFIQVWK